MLLGAGARPVRTAGSEPLTRRYGAGGCPLAAIRGGGARAGARVLVAVPREGWPVPLLRLEAGLLPGWLRPADGRLRLREARVRGHPLLRRLRARRPTANSRTRAARTRAGKAEPYGPSVTSVRRSSSLHQSPRCCRKQPQGRSLVSLVSVCLFELRRVANLQHDVWPICGDTRPAVSRLWGRFDLNKYSFEQITNTEGGCGTALRRGKTA